jgi:hypothetical protein
MAQRDNCLPFWVLVCTTPYNGAPRRCPVQPDTPLGPDQVSVLLFGRSEGPVVNKPARGCRLIDNMVSRLSRILQCSTIIGRDSTSLDIWQYHRSFAGAPQPGRPQTFPSPTAEPNNNNTFTWSGPNGLSGFTGQRRVAAAVGGLHVVKSNSSRCAIEPAESPDDNKPSAEEKDHDSGLGRHTRIR